MLRRLHAAVAEVLLSRKDRDRAHGGELADEHRGRPEHEAAPVGGCVKQARGRHPADEHRRRAQHDAVGHGRHTQARSAYLAARSIQARNCRPACR